MYIIFSIFVFRYVVYFMNKSCEEKFYLKSFWHCYIYFFLTIVPYHICPPHCLIVKDDISDWLWCSWILWIGSIDWNIDVVTIFYLILPRFSVLVKYELHQVNFFVWWFILFCSWHIIFVLLLIPALLLVHSGMVIHQIDDT